MSSENKTASGLPIVAWGPLNGLLVGLAAFLAPQVLIGLVLAVVARGSEVRIDELVHSKNLWLAFVMTAITELLAIGVLYLFLKGRKLGLRALGFRKPQWQDLLYIIGGWVVYFVVLLILFALLQLIPGFQGDQAQETGFEGARGAIKVLPLIGLVIIPPIAEEMLFRGFFYQGLKRRLPVVLAAFGTSLLFGAAHGQWNVAVDTFIFSMVLIVVFEKTGNLWTAIGLHMLKNGIAFATLFLFK